jgi:hypothetical protein
MAPIRVTRVQPDVPPSNIAQMGMAWDVATGTIDLGLGFFDAIIMVGEWIREYRKRKSIAEKAAIQLKRGKKQTKTNITRRDGTKADWT